MSNATMNAAVTRTLAIVTRATAGVPCSKLDARHVNRLVRRGLIRVETSQDAYGESLAFAV